MNIAKLTFLCFLFSFLTFSCQPNNKVSKNAENVDVPGKPSLGSIGTPSIPGNFKETQLLLTDYWVYEFYVIPEKVGVGPNFVGTWYKFNPNGSYSKGQFQETFDNGNWYISERPSEHQPGKVFRYIYFDSAVNDLWDVGFEIQGTSGFNMSWVKQLDPPDGESGLAKVMKMLTKPTREQLGR
jgi:hypothetical protein